MVRMLVLLLTSLTLTSCKFLQQDDNLEPYIGQAYTLCRNEAVGSTYLKYHFIDETDITWTEVQFSADDCEPSSRIQTRFLVGQYKYNAQTKVFSELFLKEYLTVHDSGLLNTFNGIVESCGLNGQWQLNFPVDITGLENCDGGDFTPDTVYFDRANTNLDANTFVLEGETYSN